MKAALLALAAGLAGVAAVGTSDASIVSFQTPSHNIGCIYVSASQSDPANLRCDIRSRLRPVPVRPKACDLDFGDSVELGKTGRPTLVCHGDTALDPRARVLAYGTTWAGGGFKCLSRTTGLRCSNLSGHGFFLSREHSYTF